MATDRPGLQQLAEEVSEETSVLLPWRQHQRPRDLQVAAQGHASVLWQSEEQPVFCLERQSVPWQDPLRAHPDLYLFVVAVLITSWLKQMTDLTYLVESEVENISDRFSPLCLGFLSFMGKIAATPREPNICRYEYIS